MDFKVLERNSKGRDFVIGDLHGYHVLLRRAMRRVNFDPDKDRIISVGDLIDRGPESKRCIKMVLEPWFHAVRGNHEAMLLDVYMSGRRDDVKLANYEREGMDWVKDTSPKKMDLILAIVEKIPVAMELETADGRIGFVHANVPKGMSWDTFKKHIKDGDPGMQRYAVSSRERIEDNDTSGVEGIDRVFVGHFPLKQAKSFGNVFAMDSGAYYFYIGGRDKTHHLTIADVRAPKKQFNQQAAPIDGVEAKICAPTRPGLFRNLMPAILGR